MVAMATGFGDHDPSFTIWCQFVVLLFIKLFSFAEAHGADRRYGSWKLPEER